jgi:hypothetical protein
MLEGPDPAPNGRSADDNPVTAFIDILSGRGKSALIVFPEGSWHRPSPPPFTNISGFEVLISCKRIDVPGPAMGTVQWSDSMLRKY